MQHKNKALYLTFLTETNKQTKKRESSVTRWLLMSRLLSFFFSRGAGKKNPLSQQCNRLARLKPGLHKHTTIDFNWSDQDLKDRTTTNEQ